MLDVCTAVAFIVQSHLTVELSNIHHFGSYLYPTICIIYNYRSVAFTTRKLDGLKNTINIGYFGTFGKAIAIVCKFVL